jgi:hypothetical protein
VSQNARPSPLDSVAKVPIGAGLTGVHGRQVLHCHDAERLVVGPATARTHVSRAMVKLGARDRAQLVVVAYQTGLVSPGPAPPPG